MSSLKDKLLGKKTETKTAEEKKEEKDE